MVLARSSQSRLSWRVLLLPSRNLNSGALSTLALWFVAAPVEPGQHGVEGGGQHRRDQGGAAPQPAELTHASSAPSTDTFVSISFYHFII